MGHDARFPAELPFSARVSSDAWRREADAWIGETVAVLGGRVLAVTQPRVRPWSTQLVAETELPDGPGQFWFKANCRAQSFEPALQSSIATLLPGSVMAPVAIDPERGWMITADHGVTLGDARGEAGASADDWLVAVEEWTGVQRAVAARAAEFIALGVPDCSPATVPQRFELMLERVLGLPAGHPSAPDADTAAALRAARPGVADAVATLVASGLPATLQHGDLHPWNVFAAAPGEGGRLRAFDFGDAQWAHPAEAVLIPIAIMEHAGLDPAPVVDAFHRAWAGDTDADADWAAVLAAAEISQAVNRSLTWWDCLAEANDDETAEWGEAMLRHLSRVLDPSDRPA
ncbi:phosphotransferase [Agromyces sp. NPDC055520]